MLSFIDPEWMKVKVDENSNLDKWTDKQSLRLRYRLRLFLFIMIKMVTEMTMKTNGHSNSNP